MTNSGIRWLSWPESLAGCKRSSSGVTKSDFSEAFEKPTVKQRGAFLALSLLAFLAAFHVWGPFILLGPGLLANAARGASPKQSALIGLVFGLSFAALFHLWSLTYGLLPWLGLILARGLPWLVFTLLCATKRPGLEVSAGFGLAGTSWLLLAGITGNDWEQPMAALAPYPQLLSTLPWLGLVGSAFLIGLASSLLLGGTKQGRISGFSLLIIWTVVSLLLYPQEGRLAKTDICLIQTGWAQDEKWDKNGREEGIDRLFELTTLAQQEGAELVVWPETAWPNRAMRRRPSDSRAVGKLARRLKVNLLASSIEEKSENDWHNSVSQILPSGRFHQEYVKVRLAPFTEYLPLPEGIETFLRGFPPFNQISKYVPGKESSVFQIGQERFAIMICYESMEPALSRSLATQVDFFVVMTNDAPLQTHFAKEFHFRSAILRAAATRTPVYQASNNGVSGIIDHRGAVYRRTEKDFSGPTVLTGF